MKTLFRSGLVMLSFISTLATNAQIPLLNSNTAAPAVIFLDFDGQTVDATVWNYNGPIFAGASGLNNTQITTIFNRVAEDYRPFNVNITTDSTKYFAAPVSKRTRVILTVTSDWYGSAGGVAFLGSFTWGDDTPCFVFSALLNYSPKNIAEAASHEAGHTLGLYHQSTYDVNCVKVSDYSYGQGAGEIGWAPIMGVGYYQNFTTWNNGPNSIGCNNMQNDLNVITSTNFSYRTDDFQETFPSAAVESFTSNQFMIDGMISTPTDRDAFKFTLASPKRVTINAIPKNVGAGNAGSNLDISLQLFNSATTSIGFYNPDLALDAAIDTILSAGTYYLRIDGVGNQYTPEYGSLGEYTITAIQADPIMLALHKLELHGDVNGDKHHLSWVIEADEQVTKQILEISTDGRNFAPVTQSPVADRSFTYAPTVTSTAKYRLNVTFDNGHQYYSNIVALRKTSFGSGPQLSGNLITTNTISVTSPGSYQYAIYDLSGKTVSKGQLTNGLNTITASGMNAGMYIIRFADGTDQWMDKFVRQ